MKKTLYQKTRLGKIQQWTIWTKEKGDSGFPEVHVEFGQVNGKQQTTFDVVKEGVNLGKANATTAYEQAKLEMERQITKQREEGYRDTIKEAQVEQTIDFNERLSNNLCFYKPKNRLDEAKLAKLEKNKKAVFTVKRNGLCHILRKTAKFDIEIYSRRMDLKTENYPHLVEGFKHLPNDTILLGEMVIKKNGKDSLSNANSICRSDPDEAAEKQKKLGKISYYIFDVAFYKGVNCLTSKTYTQRMEIINSLIPKNNEYILGVEKINKSHIEAMKEVKERELEGLVVWDADGIMEDGAAFTFNGKSYRPNLLWKSKPIFEDDFICRWNPEEGIGAYGKGKNKTKLKSVQIYQLDENGKEIDLGKCGGGLSDKQKEFYTDISKFPRVWTVEYTSIQPKTGALQFPVFSGIDRTTNGDKEMSECLMSDDIRAAREIEDEDEDENEEE